MADLKALRRQSAEMGHGLCSVLSTPFEETTELQRQLLASFAFGMLFATGCLNKLTPPDLHALSICLLIDVFNYSKDQAAAFAENLIAAASGSGNPTINAVIHRGIDGHRQWEAGQMSELKGNVEDIFKTVGA
jgi:Immunity protein 48